jgi:hypothetical protein
MMIHRLYHIGLTILLAATLVSCSEDSSVTNPPTDNSGDIANKDSLSGNIKGVMKTDKTYYLTNDAFVAKGDTLTIEPGARLIDLNNHTLFVRGALFANGSQEKMIYMGPDEARKQAGAWGGVQCDSPSVASFKWCQIEYAGGLRPDGRPRPAIYYYSNAANTSEFILEDCYVYKPKDDGFTIFGGHGRVLRNQFIWNGEIEGSGINFKTGFTGIAAYNYIWSCVDQCVRVETSSTVLFPQTNVEIYNNTIINSGHKNSSRPGAAVKMDFFARGKIYNNIFVNTRLGLYVTSAADTANCEYGNNLFYTTIDSLKKYFYPPDGKGKPQSTDLINVDPMFVHFNPDVNATTDDNDVHLQAGSPATGAGNTNYDEDLGCWGRRRNQ